MQIIDYSAFDHLSQKQRNTAISLVGDGLDGGRRGDFGIAVGDKLFLVTPKSGAGLTASFAGLLPIELAESHDTLVTIEHDPRIWDSAMREYLRWRTDNPAQENPGFALSCLIEVARSYGTVDHPVRIMLGQSGIAFLAESAGAERLSYIGFEPLRSWMTTGDRSFAPIALAYQPGTASPEDAVRAALIDIESTAGCPERDVDGSFCLALASLERARIVSREKSPHPEEAQLAAGCLVMPRF